MSEKNSKVFGCVCEGTGIDPTFQDACKCTQEVSASEITEKQAKFIQDLIIAITAVMKVDLTWAKVSTKKEASVTIDLLKAIKAMVIILKVKRSKLTPEQVEAIRAKINAKPEMGWINAATKKLVTL